VKKGASIVTGAAAKRALGEQRGLLLRALESRSLKPVEITLDIESGVVLLLSLDYPAAPSPGARREHQALAFLQDFQSLIDPRVGAGEYIARRENQGCDNTTVVLDRAFAAHAVLGSKLTLHFSRAGHLVGLLNGVVSVPSRVLEATALGEARLSLQKLQQPGGGMCRRYGVLAPEGSGDAGNLRHANLVVWDEWQKGAGLVYKAAFEGMAGGLVGPFVFLNPRSLPAGPGRFQAGRPAYHIDPQTGLPDSISYHPVGGVKVENLPGERNPAEVVYRFLEQHRALFRTGAPRCQYGVKSISETALLPGVQFVRMAQRHVGLPVFGAELVFEVHDGNRVMSIEGHALPRIELNPVPKLGEAEAAARARGALVHALRTYHAQAAAQMMPDVTSARAETEIVVFPGQLVPDRGLPNRLAYKVALRDYVYFIDAQTGDTIYSYVTKMESIPVIKDGEGRSDSGDSRLLYQTVWIDDRATGAPPAGAPPGSAPLPLNDDVRPLVATVRAIDRFYRSLGRDSWDGHGGQYVVNTNVNVSAGNAFFSNDYNEVFMKMDIGRQPDIVGHEFTHGVVHTSSALVYQDQSGALNEAYADLFGNLIFPDDPSPGATSAWLVGEPATSGGPAVGPPARRDMQTPSNIPNSRGIFHPNTMEQYISRSHPLANCVNDDPTSCDNGFVHSNSGIINRAHVLLADGIPAATPTPPPTPTPSPLPLPTLGPRLTPGIGRAKLAKLAYLVVTEKLSPMSRFIDASLATRNVMETLIRRRETAPGGGEYVEDDLDEVRFAFDAVGLNPEMHSGWGEPEIVFGGRGENITEVRKEGWEVEPKGCTAANVRGFLVTDSGDLGADLLPSSPDPSSREYFDIFGAGFVIDDDGPSPPPPIGTTSQRHEVFWYHIYGFKPAFETWVVPNAPPQGATDCVTPPNTGVERVKVSEIKRHGAHSPGEGGDGTEPVGKTASTLDSRCVINRVELELVKEDDTMLKRAAGEVTETTTVVNIFGNSVSVTRGARFAGVPPSGAGTPGQTRDLSVAVRWYFDGHYKWIKYRLVYFIQEPSGVNCEL